MNGQRQLRRSHDDRIVAGLCGGLGDFFDLDPVFFRIAFVLLAFAGGGGLVLYLVLTLVVPAEGRDGAGTRDTMRRGAEDLADSVRDVTEGLRGGADGDRRRKTAAILLILVGAILLFQNLDWLDWLDAGWIWPVLLIGLGIWLLSRRERTS